MFRVLSIYIHSLEKSENMNVKMLCSKKYSMSYQKTQNFILISEVEKVSKISSIKEITGKTHWKNM